MSLYEQNVPNDDDNIVSDADLNQPDDNQPVPKPWLSKRLKYLIGLVIILFVMIMCLLVVNSRSYEHPVESTPTPTFYVDPTTTPAALPTQTPPVMGGVATKTPEVKVTTPTPEVVRTYTSTPLPTFNLTAGAEATRSAALTAESAPTQQMAPATPTVTTVPPTATQGITDSFAWVLADTPYSNETAMKGGMKFEGPAICEWWDHKGFAFKATYDPNTTKVNVTELHEAMFPLMEGESYTYPAGYVGTCWTVDSGDVAIAGLMDSYRHLLFFSNVYGNQSDEIKTLKAEGKIWDGMVVDGKEVHIYMHTWLSFYDLGACNFRDQAGCNTLAYIIVQPPLGTFIE